MKKSKKLLFRALYSKRPLWLMALLVWISFSAKAQEQSTYCEPHTICLGQSVDLFCSCGATNFTGPGVQQNGNQFTFNSTLTGVGVFTLIGYCPLSTSDFTITVVPQLNLLINGLPSSTVQLCVTSLPYTPAVTLTGATGTTTYLWSPTTGLSNPNIANPTFSSTSPQTYTLTVTNEAGCIATATLNLNPQQTNMTISASDQTICAGEAALITFGPSLPGTTFKITKTPPGGFFNNSSGSLNPILTETTTYMVELNNYACEIPASITIQVFPEPTVTLTSVAPTNGQCNGSVTANVTYTGNASDLTYMWYRNGNLLNLPPNTSVVLNACPGTYYCYVSGLGGCQASANLTLSNVNVPAYSLVVGQDICNAGCGGTITLTSGTQFTVQWNAPLNSTSATLTGVCAGTYTGTINFTGGASVPITATISEAPGIPMGPINGYSALTPGQNFIVLGDLVINNGGTLVLSNNTMVVYGNVIVNPGGKLQLLYSTIKMQKDKGIIVKKAGYIKSEFSTFTNACANEFWMGIELWGNPTSAQTLFLQARGDLLKGTVIENAHKGICFGKNLSANYEDSNSGGGYAYITEATFINNRRDVMFMKYPASNSPTSNLTKFEQCQFQVNASAFFQTNSNYTMKDRVYMISTNAISFKGCHFYNNHYIWSNTFAYTSAINAVGAPFLMDEFTDGMLTVPSIVEGFVYGIFNQSQSIQQPYKILNTTFRCYRGIYSANLTTSSLLAFNNFYPYSSSTPGNFPQVPTGFLDTYNNDPNSTIDDYINNLDNSTTTNFKSSYGIYLLSPREFTLKNNYFNIFGNSDVLRVGLYVNKNTQFNNDLQSNYFEGMVAGCRFYNQNRFGTSDGLQFSCNVFKNNVWDVEITRSPGITTTTDDTWGIKKVIGSPPPNSQSRGNSFSQSTSSQPVDDIRMTITGNLQTYIYSVGELNPGEVSPSVNATTFPNTTPTGQCTLPNGSPNLAILLSDKLAEIEALRSENLELVDGGNTSGLVNEIEMAEYSEALELYYNLIQLSPALSRDAMMEAIDKEYELPVVLLTAILASNPSAAKDPAIQNQLDNRLVPLSQYQRDMIAMGKYILSLKEINESRLGDLMAEYNQLRNELYRRICEDETELNKFQLLDSLMSLPTDVSNAWIKTLWLADGGHYNQAQVLGQSLLTLLSNKDERKTDWQAYLQLLELQEVWEQDSIVVLDSMQVQMLEGWMDENLPHTFGLALNMLTRYSDYIYYEPLNYGEPLENKSLQFSTVEDKAPNWLMLYPNPTSGLTYLRLTNAPLTTGALLKVLDPIGKVIMEINLARQNFEYPMDFTTLATGTYQIQILDQEQSIYRSALIKL